MSGRTRPSPTVRASSVRSSSEVKLGTLRRYGSAPGVCAVDCALAMFSEITRMRPAWARRPEVAIPIDRVKSLTSSAMSLSPQCLALADGGLQQTEAAGVERRGRREIHLVGRHLQHLVLEIDGVAGGAGLVAAAGIG